MNAVHSLCIDLLAFSILEGDSFAATFEGNLKDILVSHHFSFKNNVFLFFNMWSGNQQILFKVVLMPH